MGIFGKLAEAVSKSKKTEETEERVVEVDPEPDIYCQHCNRNLTEGGDVSLSGRIYCDERYKSKKAPCGMIAFLVGKDNYEYVSMKYHNPKETREAIREGNLTQFGKLERKIEGK